MGGTGQGSGAQRRRQRTTHRPFLGPPVVCLTGVLRLRDGGEFERSDAGLKQVDGVLRRVGRDEGGHRATEGVVGDVGWSVEICEKVGI